MYFGKYCDTVIMTKFAQIQTVEGKGFYFLFMTFYSCQLVYSCQWICNMKASYDWILPRCDVRLYQICVLVGVSMERRLCVLPLFLLVNLCVAAPGVTGTQG